MQTKYFPDCKKDLPASAFTFDARRKMACLSIVRCVVGCVNRPVAASDSAGPDIENHSVALTFRKERSGARSAVNAKPFAEFPKSRSAGVAA